MDRIFICVTWHHIANHGQYLARLKKALKPGGQVIVIDFMKAATAVAPPAEMRIAREAVVTDFEQAGFRLARQDDMLPYQYFLVFTPVHADGT